MFGLILMIILLLKISGSISAPPSPIRVSTSAGQVAAKHMLDENEYEVHASSQTQHQTTPSIAAEHRTTPHLEAKEESRYAKKKRIKIAKLIKEGLHPQEAERRYLDKMSTYQRKWASENLEKTRRYNKNSLQRATPERKEKRKAYKRKSYHIRKAINEAFFDGQVKSKEGTRNQTYSHKYENRVKTNINKGMSHPDAKEEADKYIEQFKNKNRLRARKNYKYKPKRAEETSKSNAHSLPESQQQ